MFCLKCPQQPPLRAPWIDTPIAEAALTIPTEVYCRGCGYSFGKEYKSKLMWRCTKCNDYFVCTNCKLCKNNHHLNKRYQLKNHASSGSYTENSYSCDLCSAYVTLKPVAKGEDLTEAQKFEAFIAEQNGKTGNSFVWHCVGCKYDICPKHFTNPKLGVYKPKQNKASAVEQAAAQSQTLSEMNPQAAYQLQIPQIPQSGLFGAMPYGGFPTKISSSVAGVTSIKPASGLFGLLPPSTSGTPFGNMQLPPAPTPAYPQYLGALSQFQGGLFSSTPKQPVYGEGDIKLEPFFDKEMPDTKPLEMFKSMYNHAKKVLHPTTMLSTGPPLSSQDVGSFKNYLSMQQAEESVDLDTPSDGD